MAVTARPVPSAPGRREGPERPGPGFELWTWLFMRLSGIVLLFLAVGHVLIMHVMEEGVQRVDWDFVAGRWASAFWRTWDWLLLSLALLHGLAGLRTIILDYVRRPGWRLVWNSTFGIIGLVLFALGTIVVFTFDPSRFTG